MSGYMPDLTGHVEHMRGRFLQDVLAEATSVHYLRRAAAFERARPRPGDFTGRASQSDLAELDQRMAGYAQACRNAASVALLQGDIPPEVAQALREAA